MINKKYLKFLIIVLITNLLIFVINQPISSSEKNNSICQSLDLCVFLYDQPLFEIKAKAGEFTPEQRANIIQKRIVSQAKDMSINTDSFYATQIDNSTMAAIASNSIDKNQKYLVTITQDDAKAAKVKSPLKLATEYNKIIQKAINNHRNSIRGSPGITFSLLAVSFVILIHQFFWNLPVFFWNSLISIIRRLLRWCNRKEQSKENTNYNSSQGSSSDPNDTPIIKMTYEQIKEQYREGGID